MMMGVKMEIRLGNTDDDDGDGDRDLDRNDEEDRKEMAM